MTRKVTIFIAVLTAVQATTVKGVVLTHGSAGTLFNEDFEGQTVGTEPSTAGVNPGGNGEQWGLFKTGGSTASIRDAASDGALDACQGAKYLSVHRSDTGSADLHGDFAPNQGSGLLTFSFAAYVPSTSTDFGMMVRFDNLSGNTILSEGANIGMQFYTRDAANNHTLWYSHPSSGPTDTGLSWTADQWQEYTVDYNLDTDTFDISIAGVGSVTGLTAFNDLSDISRLVFRGGNDFAGPFYIDAIPALPSLDGDLNDDGFVGQDDLNLVLGSWGLTVEEGNPADPSNDLFVGQDDLNEVLGDWGQGTPPGGLQAVPEPRSLLLVSFLALIFFQRWVTQKPAHATAE